MNEASSVYGYKTKYGTCPIFVTYEKTDDISATTKYGDEFIDDQTFNWYTRSRRSLKSPEIQPLLHQKESQTRILLFIKKNDDEGTGFYYIGDLNMLKGMDTSIADENGQAVSIVNMVFKIDKPVQEDIYQYFVG